MNLYEKLSTTRDKFKSTSEPIRLRIESDPYVALIGSSFVPVIDVYSVKLKREYYLPISARSIGAVFSSWLQQEYDSLVNIEFWINKESDERYSKYEIELY